ncbi:MAG: hypothetical protein V4519_01570 [Patescibacteria group bacterium]
MHTKKNHSSKNSVSTSRKKDIISLVCVVVCFCISAFLLLNINTHSEYEEFVEKYGAIDQSAFSSYVQR